MSDYVVAGLQLTPVDATYLEQRDAVLAAIGASSAEDLATAAAAFSRRGAGTCAVVPDRYSPDFVGVTESSELKPVLVLGAVQLDDSVRTCDQDGILDADERGHLTFTVSNAGPVPMNDTQFQLATTTTGITFPNGAGVSIPTVAPFSSKQLTVDVALDPSILSMETLMVDVQVTNAAACTPSVTRTVGWAINVDDRPAQSASDPVESSPSRPGPWAAPAPIRSGRAPRWPPPITPGSAATPMAPPTRSWSRPIWWWARPRRW